MRPQDALIVREDADVRWHRCLRCDAWVALPPPSSRPAAIRPTRSEIEIPLRGKALRDKVVLRVIAIERAFHFVILGLLGIAVLRSPPTGRSLRARLLPVLTAIQGGAPAAGPEHRPRGILGEFDKLFTLRTATLTRGRLRAPRLRAAGGRRGGRSVAAQRWAEYLTFLATTLLLAVRDLRDHHEGHGAQGDRLRDQPSRRHLPPVRQAAVWPARRRGADERPRAPTPAGRRSSGPPSTCRRRGRSGSLTVSDSDPDAVEEELDRVGRELFAAFPSASRNPVKALDARAMELATGDQELRAALFRFVDVVPACRSLDDLARHLTAFLDEVPETPAPLSAAMRISGTRAGRAALGAAAAGGVSHLAHRFIVGETPAAALARCAACGIRAWPARWTCSAKPRSPRPRPTAMPDAAPTRSNRWRAMRAGRPGLLEQTASGPAAGPTYA